MNSFRRPGKAIHFQRQNWRSWIDAHTELVAAAGLPATTIATEDAWWYFIDRTYSQAGYLGTDIWFDVDSMTPEQRRACMTLIEWWITERAAELEEHTVRQLRATFGNLEDAG